MLKGVLLVGLQRKNGLNLEDLKIKFYIFRLEITDKIALI